MFPVTDKSKTIVEGLLQALHEKQVTLLTNTVVTKLLHDGTPDPRRSNRIRRIYCALCDPDDWWSNLPFDWSNWRRLQNGQKVGHTITPLYPTESPLISEETFIKERTLQGISLQDIALSVLDSTGKPLSLIPWISCSRISGFRVQLHCAALLLSIKN